MKTKIMLPTVLSLAVLALAGCGQQPAENKTPPAATNSAANQAMPGAAVSNNVVTPVPPAPNSESTNASGAVTNQ